MLDAYTIHVALCLRTHFFFSYLRRSATTLRQIKEIKLARKDFVTGVLRLHLLYNVFKKKVVDDALNSSANQCYKLALDRCSNDEKFAPCCVCLEKGANFYMIHGGTAHKCVCAVCAMKISIKKTPKCPVCRQDVSLVAQAAPLKLKCICGEKGCLSVLVLPFTSSNNSVHLGKASAECSTCTIESFDCGGFKMVYKLYQ